MPFRDRNGSDGSRSHSNRRSNARATADGVLRFVGRQVSFDDADAIEMRLRTLRRNASPEDAKRIVRSTPLFATGSRRGRWRVEVRAAGLRRLAVEVPETIHAA